MIVLNKDSWFVKYWLRLGCTERGYEKIVDGYREYISDPDEREKLGRIFNEFPPGTNLCQLVRINIYALLRIAFILGVIGFVISFITINPVMSMLSVIAFLVTIFTGYGFAKLINYLIFDIPIKNSLPIQYYK